MFLNECVSQEPILYRGLGHTLNPTSELVQLFSISFCTTFSGQSIRIICFCSDLVICNLRIRAVLIRSLLRIVFQRVVTTHANVLVSNSCYCEVILHLKAGVKD